MPSRASARCSTQLDRELVGLEPVKTRIREIAALLLVEQARAQHRPRSGSRRRCTCASPAIPAPARRPWRCAWRRSCIASAISAASHVVAVTRDDLVGQYIGHTAPKTKEVLKKAMGGVLFIDEAYYLYRPENERDYGQEAIEILLQVMENQRDDLVVILAGYKDRMETFFQSNPGMASRIAHTSISPTTTPTSCCRSPSCMLAGDAIPLRRRRARRRCANTSRTRMQQPHFANARSIRNALDRARLRQANRLFAERARPARPQRRAARSSPPTDIRASRVFAATARLTTDTYKHPEEERHVRTDARRCRSSSSNTATAARRARCRRSPRC